MGKFTVNFNWKWLLFLSLVLNLIAVSFVSKRLYYKFVRDPKAINKYRINVVVYDDSRVSGGNWESGLDRSDVANLGIGGLSTKGLLMSLDSLSEGYKPKIALIQIGVNDLRTSVVNLDTVNNRYCKILKRISLKNMRPVASSIIPLRKDFWQDDATEDVVNARVDSLNTMIRAYCSLNKITYLDINKPLTKGGRLERSYTYDGIHLNEKGYQIVYKQVKDFLASQNK